MMENISLATLKTYIHKIAHTHTPAHAENEKVQIHIQYSGAGAMGHEGARAPSYVLPHFDELLGTGGTVRRRMTSDQRLLETSFRFVCNNNLPLQSSAV